MTMKRILLFMVLPLFLFSCGTQKTLTPTELKMMTTRQIEAGYSLAFSSVISLLQSEGFLVTNTDRESGIINANKQVDNKNAAVQRFFLGSSTDATTAQVAVFIQSVNEGLSEVKLTIYEGSISTTNGQWGIQNKSTKNSMVQEAEVYNTWFNNLRAEVERRKALLQ